MSKTAELLKRVAALEAVVAGIGHNGAFLDDDEPPKRKPALIPDRDVARRYGVSVRTVERWSANPGLGFPAAIYIRHRRYRSVNALDQWDRDCARRVADPNDDLQYVPEALSRPRALRGRFTKPVETR